MNTIQPIQPIQTIDSIKALNQVQTVSSSTSSPEIPFRSLFQDAVSNAEQTNDNLNSEIYELTTGKSDNLHDAIIASQKASLSLDLVVELRNKLLDAYQNIMNINV
jgi:flagellar hook-basal body complex protein FliE